jgi:putative component of membrane protein insertase Oxa1/YidC/SpoIIIJ protein YidD
MRIIVFICFYFLLQISLSIAQNQENKAIQDIYQTLLMNQKKDKLLKQKKYQNNFYKKYFAAQISANCQFQTSCSEFMSESIQKLGYTKGLLLGIDRLSRCGTSESTYQFLPALKEDAQNGLHDEVHFYEK